MEFEKRIEDIEKRLHEKGINIETQDHVIQYVQINQKLFGHFLDTDKLVDRIVNNLDENIKSIDTKSNLGGEMVRISSTYGNYNAAKKAILINPINKIRSILFEKQKQRQDSTIRHEIDHCATTRYVNISEQEKEYYTQKAKEYGIQNVLKKTQFENKKIDTWIEKNIRGGLKRILQKCKGMFPIIGILDYRYVVENNIELRNLNEGITAYKQELYDEFLGNKPHTAYKAEKSVAKFIANVIGKEELINLHFNNNYEGIRMSFNEKTGKDLNDLVKKLNKSVRKRMLFGEIYARSCKEMESLFGNFDVKEEQKSKADFIPKFNPDYTAIAKVMEENEVQHSEKNKNREIFE